MPEPGRSRDLIVVGAGPAGTTLATLVKKYAPQRSVLLVEKCRAARHHVGESLLPGLVPVLKEMGVLEKVDSAGFPRKLGANYVWGRDRRVWENDFNDVNVSEMLARHGRLPEKLEYAWQVRRSAYDEILLEHARESGVEVRRGFSAESLIEEGGRVVGLAGRQAGGPSEELRAEFVADCSGQSGFLSRFKRVRRYNPALRNVAAYAYFRGAPWKVRFSGHPDKTKIFVCSTEHGWFWYIPIGDDTVSVGLVTSAEHLKESGLGARALYFRQLRACPELWPLLKAAEPIRDFDGTGQDFFTHADWSYLNISAAGPGWLAAGDAAVFVDPILSSGVTLAHLGAQRAAYTLLTHWSRGEESWSGMLWSDYNAYCRESAAQFLALALFWYGNDRCAENWWLKAREVQRAWLPVDMADQAAFITVSAGLTRHYERSLSAAALASDEPLRPEDFPFYRSVLRAGGLAAARRRADGRPRLLHPYQIEIVFAPAGDGPALRPVKRIRFLKHDPQDPLADALNPRRAVTRLHLELLERIDGEKTVSEILQGAAESGAPSWWLEGPALDFLEELSVQGVLEFTGTLLETR